MYIYTKSHTHTIQNLCNIANLANRLLFPFLQIPYKQRKWERFLLDCLRLWVSDYLCLHFINRSGSHHRTNRQFVLLPLSSQQLNFSLFSDITERTSCVCLQPTKTALLAARRPWFDNKHFSFVILVICGLPVHSGLLVRTTEYLSWEDCWDRNCLRRSPVQVFWCLISHYVAEQEDRQRLIAVNFRNLHL